MGYITAILKILEATIYLVLGVMILWYGMPYFIALNPWAMLYYGMWGFSGLGISSQLFDNVIGIDA